MEARRIPFELLSQFLRDVDGPVKLSIRAPSVGDLDAEAARMTCTWEELDSSGAVVGGIHLTCSYRSEFTPRGGQARLACLRLTR